MLIQFFMTIIKGNTQEYRKNIIQLMSAIANEINKSIERKYLIRTLGVIRTLYQQIYQTFEIIMRRKILWHAFWVDLMIYHEALLYSKYELKSNVNYKKGIWKTNNQKKTKTQQHTFSSFTVTTCTTHLLLFLC